jgi:hypothetical protein
MRVAGEAVALDRGSVWEAVSLAAVEAQVQEAAQGDRVDPAGEAVELAVPRAAVRPMPEICGVAVVVVVLAPVVDLPVGVLARAAQVDLGARAEAPAEWAGPEAVEVAPVLVAGVAVGAALREALSGLVIRANG